MKEHDADNCCFQAMETNQMDVDDGKRMFLGEGEVLGRTKMDPIDLDAGRSMFKGPEKVKKNGLEHFLSEIVEWEYCYCVNCKTIVFSKDLEATEEGIRCSKCKGYKLEAPGWVICPHHKDSAVKCARAGKGIVKSKYESECKDHCSFRLS